MGVNGRLTETEPAGERFIKKTMVAERMGLTTRAVEKMMRREQIPYYKFGSTVGFLWSEILQELARTCRHPLPQNLKLEI